ncbi:type II toxin-antitoxin system HicB family antitoxin [Litorilituus sediminis]|uniref:HicB family protein n=1 Tax=Litorilituus sediminis TaxID=718192 RepID=A0A4V0ZFQ7_9GAMM|nr:type II toxin-antitoxin system HicB family antitoxin [Litorilituus sediminis]QBG34640.1 HicB family protein [Litorilituus sediminis]
MNYPIMIEQLASLDGYQVSVPDLPGCKTNVSTMDEAFSQSKKIIQSHLAILAEYGERIPEATTVEQQKAHWLTKNNIYADAEKKLANITWGMVEFDITPYLGKSHKINVTLPELLIKQIDDRVSKSINYKTRSGFIAKACIAELNKKEA